ncbi:MAG: BamA/TamA family outer membrane protein [Gemmatimonadales bacterium]
MTRRLALCGAVLVFLSSGLHAQETDPWRNSFYPVISYTGNDGFGLGAEVTWTKRAPWDATFPHRAQLALLASYSTAGSYTAFVTFAAPGLSPDWRFRAEAGAERQAHFEFYGLGDTTTWDRSLATGADKYYYRLDRRHLVGNFELSRRLHGHLWLAGAGAYSHTRFDPLSGNSVFKQMHPVGSLIDDDATGRLSLVLDTRDNEYDTRRGLLLETSALAGSGGAGYQRYTTVLRGWKAFGDYATWWVDGRVLASSTNSMPPLNAQFFLQTWENSIRSFGGVETNRGLVDQRYVGRDVLAANLNVNRDLVNVGLYGALSVHAFVDAGRVFENEGFSLTANGMKVGGGAGVALRFGRTAIYTFNFAGGPDGFVFTLGDGWMF